MNSHSHNKKQKGQSEFRMFPVRGGGAQFPCREIVAEANCELRVRWWNHATTRHGHSRASGGVFASERRIAPVTTGWMDELCGRG